MIENHWHRTIFFFLALQRGKSSNYHCLHWEVSCLIVTFWKSLDFSPGLHWTPSFSGFQEFCYAMCKCSFNSLYYSWVYSASGFYGLICFFSSEKLFAVSPSVISILSILFSSSLFVCWIIYTIFSVLLCFFLFHSFFPSKLQNIFFRCVFHFTNFLLNWE